MYSPCSAIPFIGEPCWGPFPYQSQNSCPLAAELQSCQLPKDTLICTSATLRHSFNKGDIVFSQLKQNKMLFLTKTALELGQTMNTCT